MSDNRKNDGYNDESNDNEIMDKKSDNIDNEIIDNKSDNIDNEVTDNKSDNIDEIPSNGFSDENSDKWDGYIIENKKDDNSEGKDVTQDNNQYPETSSSRRALNSFDEKEQNPRDLRKGHLTYKQMKSRQKKRVMLVISIILAAVAGYFAYSSSQNKKYDNLLNRESFYEGVYVDGIALGGLTKDEAFEKITQKQKESESEVKVIVKWDEEEIPFTSEDVDISYNTQEIIDQAFDVGREGSKKSRYKYVLSLVDSNENFETTRMVDPSPIESRVRNIAIFRTQSVEEPAVAFNPDPDVPKEEWFDYSDPIVGIQADDQALWEGVQKEYEQQTYGEVPVPKWEINPSENIDLRSITKEIVSFKTHESRNSNREHNIALACSMINGSILMPGQEFSMNNTTGERTEAAGFKEANTIVGGNELVPGIAGGVCQVSGTLFNAAFRADLEITERHHHSFELGYLSRGRDATVNYGTADLRFVNNKEYPIYIAMYTIGRDVYADIFGAPLNDGAYIDMWVKTIDETPVGDPIYVKDSTVVKGEPPKLLKGHAGIKCDIYKVFKSANGDQISSEKMYTDIYKYYAPELHVNPDDYEGYINPTPTPAPTQKPNTPNPNTPTPAPTATPSATAVG